MTEKIIQNQIRLVTFKAVKVEISCEPLTNQKAKFDLKLANITFSDNPKWFAKAFTASLIALSPGSEVVICNIEFHAVFECSNIIDQTFLDSEFAKISAPAIGFPYVRAFISTVSLQAGLPPIILPSINFVQFSKEIDEEEAAKTSRV